MKLNYKRTLLVGFAFFLICAFWQAYDTIIPKILVEKFGMSQTWSGVIMALDNILALFLLPIFGALSDKCRNRRGKRTPYILIGTLIACCLLLCLSFADTLQTRAVEKVSPDNYEGSLSLIYDPDIEVYDADAKENRPLSEIISKEDFEKIAMVGEDGKATDDYTNLVVPAREAYVASVTSAHKLPLILFIGILLCLLVAMGIYRSPAVALMPDVTPKPLRSKANAIINLMGAVGGILILGLGIVFGTGKVENSMMNYTTFFMCVVAIMMVSLVVFLFTVKEPLWANEAETTYADYVKKNGEEKTELPGDRKLSKGEIVSLVLILASVALWYTGYNAVTSKYSVYATNVLAMDYNMTLIIAQAAAIVSYIPVGIIASRVGRKKTILAGVAMLAAAFTVAAFLTNKSPSWVMTFMFILAGIGWATINVNSFPMVVELATGSNTGKYTGYYYTASMAAQVITPVLSGVFLDINMRTLFPYAAIFVALSFVTMLFVRHGDSKPVKKSVLEAIGEAED